MSIYDSSEVYSFNVTKINLFPKNQKIRTFTPNGKKVTFSEFIKAEDDEFEEIKRQSIAASNMDVKVTKNPTNPIELNYD